MGSRRDVPRTKHLNNVPVWIRVRAPRVLRGAHALIVAAALTSVVARAAAEEPNSRCDGCEASEAAAQQAPAEAAEAAPPAQEVSEATPVRSQGGAPPNYEPPAEHEQHAAPPKALPPVPAAPSKTALSLHLPEFIAFGIGGLGAGGAVVTWLAASAPYTDPKLGCNGRCADGSHMLGMTSTILAGLAVGAVGTGVVLALSGPAREKKPLTPVLKMSLSLSRAAASASWTF